LKVQAVISRTYALRHLERHKTEKVQLCDRVHCQVYHGRARFNPMIEAAVDSTHYEVIVDEKGNLIEAVFHANCGGQTVNSEDVWTLKRDYLRSVTDTFCVKSRQASWEKEIEKGAWLNYLSKKSGQTISDPCAFNHLDRLNNMPCCSVRMEDLRLEFGLKSTYFYVDEYPEKVMLVGRGFGHGVGMCQDGSIEMARLGKDYQSIIRYYYTSIQIKNWK
jgi:stage II sporulation protein D